MNIISKIFAVGAATAALALTSTAAFACTTPGNNIQTQSWQGNQPGGGKGGDPCVTSWGQPDSIFQRASQGDTLFSDTQYKGSCEPTPKPCSWDKIPVTSWVWQHGRYVKCVKDQNWNNCTPRPVTPPCPCKTQNITFETPTYGTWLKETSGPALFSGEVILYDGQDWTVGDWTTPPSHKANGSQGPGDYFTLTLNGHQLDGHGIKTQWATTICTDFGVMS